MSVVEDVTRHSVRADVPPETETERLRSDLAAGANYRLGSAILADRRTELEVCDCGETLYRGKCFNVGACRAADRAASRGSLRRGTAASARPAAWSLGGRVD